MILNKKKYAKTNYLSRYKSATNSKVTNRRSFHSNPNNAAQVAPTLQSSAENTLLRIKMSNSRPETDEETAIEIVKTLSQTWEIPPDNVMINVANGWITLNGNLKIRTR